MDKTTEEKLFLDDPAINLVIPEDEKFITILNSLKGYEEFVLDLNGIIISSNLESITISGYEEWEVIGKSFSIFYTPEDKATDKFALDLSKARKRQLYFSSGFKCKRKGDRFWAKMRIRALTDVHNEVAGYKVEIQDTTHRAMYSLATRRIKDEYLNLFNNSFVGVFKFRSSDYSCVLLNTRAKAILNTENCDKLRLNEIFFDESQFASFQSQLASTKRVNDFEFRVKTKDSSTQYCAISCKLFVNGGFIEGILTDITEKINRIDKLKSINAELDNFIYRASHDLRSPLTSVMGLVNLIDREKSPELIKQYNQKIGERIRHLDSLLKDLGQIAANNTQELNRSKIIFGELIKDVLSAPEVSKYGIPIQCDFNPSLSFIADADRLRSILNNLLSNALKFTSPTENKPFVKLAMVSDVNSIHIEIHDNGIGIPPQHLGDIFKMFFKSDSIGSGVGLGLYLVKEIIDKLNGKIHVESTVGKGTVVRFSIPIEGAHDQKMGTRINEG